MDDQTKFEKWGRAILPWAQILSFVAVPVVLAVASAIVSRSISEMDVNARMVELAVDVLRDPGSSDTDLREWARAIMDRHAPIPLPDSAVFPPRTRTGRTSIFVCGPSGSVCDTIHVSVSLPDSVER